MAKTEVIQAVDVTPLAMLEKAVTTGADIEVLERLMGLSERWQANQAKSAFSQALSNLRNELPKIVKTKSVSYGQGKAAYKYEDLAEMTEQLSPVLSKHGLSFRWRTDSTAPGFVAVTLILSHADGHSEETTLAGPYDTSGNKNPIQAIGSVTTYLQRYTLKAALGIAAAADDDGRQGEPQQQQAPEQGPAASDKQIKFARSLAKSSVITDDERKRLETDIANGIDKKTASDWVEWLQKETKARKEVAAEEGQEPPADHVDPPPGDGDELPFA